MLQWEYVRIMNRNYLQTKKEQDMSNEFQYRMMISQTIKGLLPCKERVVNGVTYQLFDISSMQSLTSIYAEKKIQFHDFYMLIFALKSTVSNMRTFLLGGENLILYPELIFRELDTGEFGFMCCPGDNCSVTGSVKQLYQFLLSGIDYDDSEFTDLIYESYEEIEDFVSMTWINKLYERLSKLQDERLQEKKRVFDEPEDMFKYDREEICCEEPKVQTQDKKIRNFKSPLLFCGIYILMVGVSVYYLYNNYVLNEYETLLFIGLIIIVTATIVIGIFRWLRKKENLCIIDKFIKDDDYEID